jgi:phenylacetate-coenzyme A ligase PaaK-like adenylate-forming protein
MNTEAFWKEALSCNSNSNFELLALELFKYQSKNVEVYNLFLDKLKFKSSNLKSLSDIPFLPVQLFKTHNVIDQKIIPDFYFTSSGTTGQVASKHFIADLSIYDAGLLEGFKFFYGDPSQYCFLALLPSYLERSGASLVYMAQKLIDASEYGESGFYLHNYEDLYLKLIQLREQKVPVFLLGVTYALLDLFEQFPIQIPDAIIMETGGMKGRRKEIVRQELHTILQNASGAKNIHSEYGMTELLSQAYSNDNGLFGCPPWMKVVINDLHDPFSRASEGETGIINVIDLANIHSCAFIATQDIGKMKERKFEVLGRIDNSELRGCNLMIT